MVGASQEQYKRQYFSATRKDLIDPSLGVIDGAIGESSSTGNITEWAMRSYFGRLNLDGTTNTCLKQTYVQMVLRVFWR